MFGRLSMRAMTIAVLPVPIERARSDPSLVEANENAET
jgi:hypothetical protein